MYNLIAQAGSAERAKLVEHLREVRYVQAVRPGFICHISNRLRERCLADHGKFHEWLEQFGLGQGGFFSARIKEVRDNLLCPPEILTERVGGAGARLAFLDILIAGVESGVINVPAGILED